MVNNFFHRHQQPEFAPDYIHPRRVPFPGDQPFLDRLSCGACTYEVGDCWIRVFFYKCGNFISDQLFAFHTTALRIADNGGTEGQ